MVFAILTYGFATPSKSQQLFSPYMLCLTSLGIVSLFSYPFLLLFLGFVLLAKDVQFEYRWNKVAKVSLSEITEETLPGYEKLSDSWNGNHLFPYNYAAELNQANDWHKNVAILHRTVAYWNDYDIQLLYADNDMKLKQWENAEPHLDLASNMCPDRFAPLPSFSTLAERQKTTWT